VVTLYGDGKQVRDVLFIDDLFELYDACIANIDRVAGNAYNVGGGPHNRLSLLELIAELEARLGTKVRRDFAPLRPGDQPVFVADIRKAARDLGWEPRISVEHGVGLLFDWVAGHRSLFDGTSSGRAA
jgi:CDP-paratose 2-epimerase